MTDDECVFCRIVAGDEPAFVVRRWLDALAIRPLGPVAEGHTLVLPTQHVADFTSSPEVTARTMYAAAEFAASLRDPCNLITSKGREATQSVFHLHVHVIPRAEDDGLALPWYSGKRSRRRGQP